MSASRNAAKTNAGLTIVPMPTFAPLPLRVQQETATLPERERAALARAQAAWMTRQQSLDPRHATYSQRATPDDLERALRLLRGLFDLRSFADLPLSGAVHWINILMDLASEAEERGQQPTLPLPYLFLFRRELDDLDAVFSTDLTDSTDSTDSTDATGLADSPGQDGGSYGDQQRDQQRSHKHAQAASPGAKRPRRQSVRNDKNGRAPTANGVRNGVRNGASQTITKDAADAAGVGEWRTGGHQPQPAGDGQGAPQDARRRLLERAGVGRGMGSRQRGRAARP